MRFSARQGVVDGCLILMSTVIAFSSFKLQEWARLVPPLVSYHRNIPMRKIVRMPWTYTLYELGR